MRAAVDVMGGDKAPEAILAGCWDAAPLLEAGDQIILIGTQDVLDEAMANCPVAADKKHHYKTVAAKDVIAMDDSPVEAVRGKPDSSISVMNKLVAKGEADVAISAGNTGACVAAAQLRMRLLPGVSRPGIAIILPTFYGPVVLCDVGANPEPKPMHMLQYGLMASAYSKAVCGIESPRVGLLSIGEEDSKGNSMTKESRQLLRDEPLINFVGNIEGKDILKGVVDVCVCDGFVGNIVLKFTEGITEGIFQTLVSEIEEYDPQMLQSFKPVMKKIYQKHDWQETGGAPLLGVGGYCLICHGRSEARAIKNAIRVGKQLFAAKVNEKIVDQIGHAIQVEEAK